MKKIFLSFMLLFCLVLAGCGDADQPGLSGDKENMMLGELPEGYEVGDTAADFQIELLNGDFVKLSDYRERYVILNYWYIGCSRCKGELPAFKKLQKKYGDSLVILAVNYGDDKVDIQEFMDEKGYDFKVGVDPKYKIEFPGDGIPYTLIIDTEGVIRAVIPWAHSDSEVMFELYDTNLEDIVNN